MGNYIATYITHPDTMPKPTGPPTFDPMFWIFKRSETQRQVLSFEPHLTSLVCYVGFTEMKVSEEDMIAARIPLKQRDYCAHKYLELHECKRIHYPFMIKCAHKRHEYHECYVEDYVLRMKEYERERRLLERQKRIEQAAAA